MAVTTTFEIRATLTAVVEALVPTQIPEHRFFPIRAITQRPSNSFRGWADANDSASFRSFDIEEIGGFENVGIQNGDVIRKRGEMLLTMCYPNAYAYYAIDAQQDLMFTDMNQIEAAIGIHGLANWPAGSVAVESLQEREEGETVRFSILRIVFEYCYST